MATGVHIQEPVLDTLRREDENEMDQAINITLGKIPVQGNVGDSHTPIEPPDTLETDFEVKDSEGNEGSASTIECEKFLKSPSAAEVHFEENNLAPDASQVTENAEKMATEHETDALHVGEDKLNAEESNGLEKGLVSALKVPATSEVGHDESIPVHEAGLSENKEDSESKIPEKEAAHMESLKVNPEVTKTCVAVNDTETTSSVEEKSMLSSTSQDIPGEKNEQTTFDTNKESPENISKFVPNEETEQNLSIKLDDSRMKADENLEKEDEKPESTLIPEEKIKNEESTQNELFESKNDKETVIQKSEEVIENGVESLPVAACEAEDIEASTSDHDTRASALEYQILTENPQEIKVDKSECKPEKETPEEQVITETTARDASHDETTPVDKAKTEDEEPNKSDFIETKEDTESTILVEEPMLEKRLESLNAIHDDIKACNLVQDTETKCSIKEKLPTATPLEIWGDKIEQTSFDTKEETPEDISTNVSNEETEQNSIVEVPFVTEALTTDNETQGKIKDEDQRENDLLENNNDTESQLLKQEVTEKPVESVQLANVADDTQASTLDHDTKISDLENQILTENPQEIVADETESKPCDLVHTKKETLDVQDVSTIESNDDNEENLVIKEDESEKPLSREESTRDAAGDESTYTHEDKNEGDDQRRAELFENPNSAESLSLIEDNTIPKLVESPQVDAEDIKTHILDQDAETTCLISASEGKSNDGEYAVKYEVQTEDDDQKEDQLCDNEKNPETNVLLEAAKIETPIESLQETLPSAVPQGFLDDKTEEKTVDAIQKDKEILDNISTIVPNEETEQNLSIELDDSHMIIDENLEKEDEKPESTLIPEGKIKNGESTQNEFFETKNETETVIQKMEEVIEKGVESLPAAASEAEAEAEAEAEDIEASTSDSDHDTETRALENQILTENPQEIEVDKSECKPEKETPEEQVSASASMTSEDASVTKHEAHLDKESEKPCFTDASMRDASNDETTPIDKAMKEEKILAPEAQNFIKVVSNENVEKDSMIQEDGSSMVHEEISEKEGETPSLSAALIPNATSEDSTVIHENKIENEDTREVDIFECEKHVDGKILDAAPEASESKIIVLDENTEEKSSNQVDKSQTKHEELLEKESKTMSLSETSLLTTSNEDSTTINDDKIEDEDPEKVDELECEKHTEFPLKKEKEPLQKLNNPLKEDIEEIKEFVSCLGTETTSSTEDRSQQINPQEVMGGQMEENIIDTTPEPQNFTTLVSDENTKENLSLEDDDESQIKHKELLENESEKPSLSILKTSNEESSFIFHSKTENEDVKRHEKVEQLNDFPEEGPEIIEVPVPSENLETTSPVEERSLTENPQENLTKDKILDVVPEALESKTLVSDKNIEDNSFILEDGSQMKQGEHSEKEIEMPSVSENSILNARSEEPTLFLDDKIEEEDQAKGNKSECEKYAEITEVSVENPNSSNLENIEAFVSCEDIEPTNSTEEQSLTVNSIENVGGQEAEKVLDKALVTPHFTPVVPDDNNDDNKLIQVDGSQMKHEEPLEKESEIPSSLETSLLNTNNGETENIHKDLTEEEALENVDEFESKKCSEINKLKEEAQVEESAVYKDIKAYVSYQDTEASALQEQILAANPQDILGNQSEDNVIDTADSKEKFTENLPVSNENVVKDSLIQIDESETQYEEISEKEPYLEKTSTVEANNESTTSHEDMIKEESGEITESALLNEGSPAYESVESLQVVSEDIKASVSSQKTDTKSSNLNADPQEIVGDQTDDKINTAGTREITLEALNLTTLDSNENEVLDSITPHDGLEIEDEEISMLADNEESIIVREDRIEGENLKKVDTFESAQQTEDTLLKEEAHEDESMDSLHVASEPIKASVSYQDRDPTSSSEEQIQTTTPQIVGDQVEEKLTDTAKTWEETPEVSSSVLEFQEDEASRIGVDYINSVMIKDEETANRSNATENDEISSSDKVQAKEEEMEIISKTKIDEEAKKDDTWIKLTDDETKETSIEEKEIDFSSHGKDTSEITQHDGAKDIPKGNKNSTSKNEFLEDGYSNRSTESTTPIVNEDAEKIDKDIKAETDITETGAASSALPITGVQCGPEETESEDSKAKETETSLAPEGREYQGQHTKLHVSPSPPLSHVKDSEWEMAQKGGRDNLQSGDDTKELDEGSVAISNEGNFLEGNLNKNIETEVTAGGKEVSAIQQNPVSEFAMQEIQEQQGKTVEAVAEEKGIKSEQGEIKFDDSDDLKINSSTIVTDKVAPSDILCSSTSDAGQRAVDQETQIIVQEKEHKPGKGKAVEAVPEEKGINTEEHNFNVLKENFRTVALDKVTPVNILQGSTTYAALRATDEATPEQYGLDEASLKEIEGGPASTTDKLTVLRADQIDNENFYSSLGSNKIPVLQHGASSESSQTEGEKQKTSESEKEEKRRNEETAKLMETSESTEMDKPSLLGLLQVPMKEVLKVVDQSIDKKEPTTKEEELQEEKSTDVEHVEAKTDEEKDGEEESGEHQTSDLSSDARVMVDAADKDVKVAYKKSHNMLSGVGSKVKHSISKVKKAITGKSSHPKSASPKFK